MAAMRRSRGPMHRYGEPAFDADYLGWGFHSQELQEKEAESVLRIAGSGRKLHILDLACGTGRHAIYWAKHEHAVTGVDLSETFIARGRDTAQQEGVRVEFVVSDVRSLSYRNEYDLVTWIENSFFDADIVRDIHGYLVDGGILVFDVRNPEHPKARARGGDWRTWREDAGVFYLERHETDEQTGLREDVWITIDTHSGLIEEKVNSVPRVWSLDEKLDTLRATGFGTVELQTLDGQAFDGGVEPYWLWVVAKK